MAASNANARQVGGSHYKGADYQHWDWVHDVRLGYHAGHASKYIDRWRRHPKGAENLEKALHYYDKAMELGIQGSSTTNRAAKFWRYVVGREHTLQDAEILWYIMEGNWQAAAEATHVLLSETS